MKPNQDLHIIKSWMQSMIINLDYPIEYSTIVLLTQWLVLSLYLQMSWKVILLNSNLPYLKVLNIISKPCSSYLFVLKYQWIHKPVYLKNQGTSKSFSQVMIQFVLFLIVLSLLLKLILIFHLL